jgi:co-chaperonin GroES (HSP10)
MSLNLKPLGDRLIVEPTEQEDTTASGTGGRPWTSR